LTISKKKDIIQKYTLSKVRNYQGIIMKQIFKYLYLALFVVINIEADEVINAPYNLQFTNVSQTSVTLTWEDNSTNESGFKIKRDGVLIFTTVANVTTYTDNNLSPNTEYIYTVYATTDTDVQAPVITLNGNPRVILDKGTAYSDLGATAVDDVDGDLTSSILTTNSVNINQAGTYTVVYKVLDAHNNLATKTRTVIVRENIGSSIYDSSFETESGHVIFEYGATYDTTLKRSGERSLKLAAKDDRVNVYDIPVEEGNWYIFRGYMYVKSVPSDMVRFYIGYSNNGSHVRTVTYTLLANATANHWEEFVVPVYIQKDKNATDIKMFIRNTGAVDTDENVVGGVWIDDMSIYKVKDTSEFFGDAPYTPKDAFDGSYVKVDSLGNFSVKDGSVFKPFFPLIVYPDPTEIKWNSYKTQGFNTVIGSNPAEMQSAVDTGLYWIWDLDNYGISDLTASGYDTFVNQYNDMKNNHPDIFDKLLYFYWDNEKYEVSKSLKKFVDKIKIMDVDANGKRYRPFNMNLSLTEGSKLYYNDTFKLMDIQSAYVNPIIYQENDVASYGYEFKDWYDKEFADFSVFENIENMRVPKSVFVVNSPQDDQLESIIFAALARGGKGFAFWRDSGSQPEIETRLWWNSFPSLATKLNQLLPLIQKPHTTNWVLEYSEPDDEDGIIVGKRDYDNKRCMIVASRADISKTISFSTPDRDMGTLYNFFDNSLVASPSAGSVTLSLPAHGSGVYCW